MASTISTSRPKRKAALRAEEFIRQDIERRKQLSEAERQAEDDEQDDVDWNPGDRLDDEDDGGAEEDVSMDEEDEDAYEYAHS